MTTPPWDEPGWYDKGALIAGLYAIEAAASSSVDALDQFRRTTDYITRWYGDDEGDD